VVAMEIIIVSLLIDMAYHSSMFLDDIAAVLYHIRNNRNSSSKYHGQ
jgi:hypothetical protein